jgi:hypothetical protein
MALRLGDLAPDFTFPQGWIAHAPYLRVVPQPGR